MDMRFHNVLDEVLGNKTKVKLLRGFFAYPQKEFSESELQRIAGIPQASVHRNVKSLLENGLLDRKRIGKVNLYSLNKKHVLHPLLRASFEGEKNVLEELKAVAAGVLKHLPEVELAVLFGSVVKGTERADSDVDILIVSKENKSQLEEKLDDLRTGIQNKFGNPVSLIIKNVDELRELKTKSIYGEIKKGEIIFRREGLEW